MVFSSALFLIYLFPVFFGLYFLAPARWKNAVALIGSLAFYTWGAPKFVFVLLASSALDFVAAQRIARKDQDSRKWLIAGILWNVLTLLIFKYFNFFCGEC